MREDERRFRKNYEVPVERQIQQRNRNQRNISQRENGRVIQYPERYTAQKGTAHRAKERKRNNKIRLRIASLLLAAGIGLGGLTIAGRLHQQPEPNITQMQEMGVSEEELGLEADTLQMMEKYDEYFENFNPKTANLTDNAVIAMIRDIEDLNFNVIKDKMAEMRNVTREDVKLYYSFDKGDGSYYSSVIINEGKYGEEERYDNNYGIIFGIGSKETIPQEIADLIVQIGSYESIINDVKSDKITKAKAIKELNRLYKKISAIAVKEFSMDDKGNIQLEEYNNKNIEKEDNERD